MRAKTVFLTGVSGYIGGTVAVMLINSGYTVSGLVRNPAQAEALRAAGIVPVLGDLHSRDVIEREVLLHDIVIHTAECDDPALASLFLTLLKGTGKTFLYTSGSAIVANWSAPKTAQFVYTEDFPFEAQAPFENRAHIHREILRSARDGVRSMVVVPSMVYGKGLLLAQESKQIPFLIRSAQERGRAAYVGDGEHRWSNVHVEDLAALFLAALEHAKPGSVFFAENGSASFREIATWIQDKLGLGGEAESLTRSQASALWGEIMATVAVGSDCRIDATKARRMLDWKPTQMLSRDTL